MGSNPTFATIILNASAVLGRRVLLLFNAYTYNFSYMPNRRSDIDEKKDYIIAKLKSGVSRARLCRELKCKYDTLKARLVEWEVDHLKNQSGKAFPKNGSRVHVSEYLVKNGKSVTSHRLKQCLFRDGYKKFLCENCGESKWMGEPIPLELHHVNGDRFDNCLENLQILCPNCHALQPNNSGKNVGSYTYPTWFDV